MDFVTVSNGRRTALVRGEWPEAIGGALLDGRGCAPAELSGRGGLMRFDYGGGAGLLRKYWRGGAIRHIMRDRYLLQNRALRELRLHARLFDMGLDVPEPLGACWERSGPFYRGWFATRELAAVNLLARAETGDDMAGILARCGAAIRRLHDAGVFHADLQVRNILVGDVVYLIDFDRARIRPSLSPLNRAQNLFRLRRSMEKVGMPQAHFPALCRAYGADALPDWMNRIVGLT